MPPKSKRGGLMGPTASSAPPRRDPLAALRMSNLVIFKPVLPAEILVHVVGYLSGPDMIRFARVSRKMHEMVYDDSHWIQRLTRMGVWDIKEARNRAGSIKTSSAKQKNGVRRKSTTNTRRDLLNDSNTVRPAVNVELVQSPARSVAADGFDTISFTQPAQNTGVLDNALYVLEKVESSRGHARAEFGKVYKAIGRFYIDALLVDSPNTSLVFRSYTAPQDRAIMFANVRTLALGDFSPGSSIRTAKLDQLVSMFDTAALLEFRQGYEYKDIQGRMRQYASVMYTLNGGSSSINLFLHDNRLISRKADLGSVSDCIDYSLGSGQLSLERVQAYFERLGNAYQQESVVIRTVFPQPTEVSLLFLEKVSEEVLMPFLGALFDEARTRSTTVYLRVISGSLRATSRFVREFALPEDADEASIARAASVLTRLFAPHLQNYLDEEATFFQQKVDTEVSSWDRSLSEQAADAESFLMSNVNRSAAKKDFMSSFKKVVMMPVNILPTFSTKSSSANVPNSLNPPIVQSASTTPRAASPALPTEAPTDELAAKAALMTARLENIKSLFSIEFALNLVHTAKSSLERAAEFIALGGNSGELARQTCSSIFVTLITAVGDRHVRTGFDRAIEHLGSYNPRSDSSHNEGPSVAPLTMFLELVNVGDLIQQMIDVFFEQEIIGMKICQRDDFLAGPVKSKRQFETMLDERVAGGLGKGIDVLMDEVEYLCATEQSPTDFNPIQQVFDASADERTNKRASMMSAMGIGDIDVSPTKPCLHIIDIIREHISMLVGSTDKSLIDVFVQEVGQRLFQTLVKHIKRQRISPLGAMRLLSDLTQYSAHIASYRLASLTQLFTSLREVAQIYLFDSSSDKEINEMCAIIADAERYGGVFTVEEVVEFAERRADWLAIRSKVEGRVKGDACCVM